MKPVILALATLAAIPLSAHADDGWKGAGELGFAASRGNSKSENLNAKLNLSFEDDTWKDNFYATALRSKGNVKVTNIVDGQPVAGTEYRSTANRYELGASAGYKLDERSYILSALRYENDDFSPFQYQQIVSIGYGYTAIRNERTSLSLEIGPGYKRVKPQTGGEASGKAVARSLIDFKHKLTDTTSFENTFLVEAGSANRFYQNDAGLVVSMNSRLALKLGYQVRHNSKVAPGAKNTDQLVTTNLVYHF